MLTFSRHAGDVPDMSHSYIIELKYARYKESRKPGGGIVAEVIAQTNRHGLHRQGEERYWHYATTIEAEEVNFLSC